MLNKEDLISDDLLKAPLVLKENLESLLVTINELVTATKKVGESNKVADTSVSDLAKDTEELTAYQKQLLAVQNQIVAAGAKSSDEYIGYKKTLKEVNDEIKRKTELGNREATSINAQNASIKQLAAALNANRNAYSNLRTEQERNSKEGKLLLKTIQDQDASYKVLKSSIGQNQDKVGDYEGAMKALSLQMSKAKDELAGIALQLGVDSKEFIEAADKAGALKNQINDLKDAVKATENAPIVNLGNAFSAVTSKLKDLDFAGAAQQARLFAQASKAITFKEAAKGLKDFGTTITTVGRAILTNPLFLLAALFIGLTILVVKFHDKIKPLKLIFDLVGGAIQYVVQALKDLSDLMGFTSFAAEENATRIADAYKKAREALVDYYETEITIANAAGANTQLLELKKQQSILETSQVQIKALDDYKKKTLSTFDLLAIATKNYFGLDTSEDYFNKLTEEQQAFYDEAIKLQKESNIQIKALELQNYVALRALNNEYIRTRKNNQYELDKFLINSALQASQKIADNNAIFEDQRNNAAKQAAKYRETLANMEAQQQKSLLNDQFIVLKQNKETELSLIGDNEMRRIEIENRFAQLEKDLRTNVSAEIILINAKRNAAIKASDEKLQKDLTAISLYTLESQKALADQQLADQSNTYDKRLQALSTSTQLEYQIIETLELSEAEALKRRLDNQKRFNDESLRIEMERITSMSANKGSKESIGNDEELAALDESYQKREISTAKYLQGRKRLNEQNAKDELGNDIQLYEAQIDLLEAYGIDATAIRERLAEARLAIEEMEAAETLAYRQKLNEDLLALGQASFDSAVQIGQNLFDAEDMKRQERLESIAKAMEEELALTEGNAEAQNNIKNKYALEEEKIRLQQKAADRKKAIFDKATAALQIGINTAIAISQAVAAFPLTGGLPFSAIVAAIGAVQLAAVLTKPIPSFAVGTENHKGGLAFVGEKGPELVIQPSGNNFITPGSTTLMNLEKGAIVKTNSDLMTQLALGALNPMDSTQMSGSDMGWQNVTKELKELQYLYKTKKEVHFNVTREGVSKLISKGNSKQQALEEFFR